MDAKLIFDIGLHRGLDAEFYLRKGFRVVGVEAVKGLCDQVMERLDIWTSSGGLKIVNKAIAPAEQTSVSFFVNPRKDDWGSLYRNVAEKGIDTAVEITVPTTTVPQLLEEFGVPYYLKSDIEGGDLLVLKQLRDTPARPTFLSVEADSLEFLDLLEDCGYELVQIINQWCHAFTPCPNPPREGLYVDTRLNNEMSGLFGRELEPTKWLSLPEARKRYEAWRYVHTADDALAPGWVDFHATTKRALA